MSPQQKIRPTPWDKRAFGTDTYELADASAGLLDAALAKPGHYTVRIDPLASTRELARCGFYYCDTLMEPWCTPQRLVRCTHEEVTIDNAPPLEGVMEICHGAFRHGRFHRDFNIQPALADARYDNWLRQLHGEGRVHGLYFQAVLAGFIARRDDCFVLHALGERYRGKSLARYFWSMLCARLFAEGLPLVRSSISAANLGALNLYASLGFKFRAAVDVYHRVVP